MPGSRSTILGAGLTRPSCSPCRSFEKMRYCAGLHSRAAGHTAAGHRNISHATACVTLPEAAPASIRQRVEPAQQPTPSPEQLQRNKELVDRLHGKLILAPLTRCTGAAAACKALNPCGKSKYACTSLHLRPPAQNCRAGNLPFRRLCCSFGAEVTMGEMSYARQLIKGCNAVEQAHLRQADNEHYYGGQAPAAACTSVAHLSSCGLPPRPCKASGVTCRLSNGLQSDR